MSIPTGDRQHETTRAPVSTNLERSEPGLSKSGAFQEKITEPPPWLHGLAWFGVVLWAATIFWFSSRTGEQIEEMNVFKLYDKLAHFIAFFSGAPPFFCALKWSTGWTVRRTILVCVLGLAIYGASDEYHQLYTPNRSGADVWDWTGDALGGLTGTLLCGFVYARLAGSKTSHRTAQAGA